MPRCASQVLDRGAQADSRSAAKVLERGAQAVSRGGARFASQVLDRGAQAVARDAATAGEEQVGRCTAEQSEYYRLCLYSGKVTLAAMYLQRLKFAGRSFMATLTHFSYAACACGKKLGLGLQRRCRGRSFSRKRTARKMPSGAE
jgi:hypothetical protein